jgi:hypothetical protein
MTGINIRLEAHVTFGIPICTVWLPRPVSWLLISRPNALT